MEMRMTGTEESKPRGAWPALPGRRTIGVAEQPMETTMDREATKDAVVDRLEFLEDLIDLTIRAHWKTHPLTRGEVDHILEVLFARAEFRSSPRTKELALAWHKDMLGMFFGEEGPPLAEGLDEWTRRTEGIWEWRRKLG